LPLIATLQKSIGKIVAIAITLVVWKRRGILFKNLRDTATFPATTSDRIAFAFISWIVSNGRRCSAVVEKTIALSIAFNPTMNLKREVTCTRETTTPKLPESEGIDAVEWAQSYETIEILMEVKQ